uniref:Uncharacterized protein n=1 Tax=Vitis vinifera TaxID=29760 RepID=A5AS68_VITVI|nr:hypothetical protein VITISV_006868 [Vitis vinifera]
MHLSLSPGLSLSSPNPGVIGCLIELYAPQGLLIMRVIASGGLKVCLSTQVDPDILKYSGKEAAVGEYSCRALNAGDHMHHHQISHVNPSPGEDRVHNKCLKDSAGHGQAVCRWFAHPLDICEFVQPLNNLSRLESWHSGPRLGLIHSKSN